MQFIVVAIIAIIVLAVIVLWATGSFKGLFGKLAAVQYGVTPDEVTAARLGCDNACFEARQLVKSRTAWLASTFCKREYNVDKDGDGKAGGYNETGNETRGGIYGQDGSRVEIGLHCWSDPILSECEITIKEEGADKLCSFDATNNECYCES